MPNRNPKPGGGGGPRRTPGPGKKSAPADGVPEPELVAPGKPPRPPAPSKPPPVPEEIAGAGTVFDEPAPFLKPSLQPSPVAGPKKRPPEPAPSAPPAAPRPAPKKRPPEPAPSAPPAAAPKPAKPDKPAPRPPAPGKSPAPAASPAPSPKIRKPGGGIHSKETAVDPEDLKPAPGPDREAVALEPVSGRKPLSGLPPVESLALPSPAGAMNDLGPPLVAEDRDAERGPPPPPAGPDSPSAPPAGPAAETDPPASGEGEEAPSAPPAGAKPFEFLGSGLGLFPLKLARLACSALGAAALLLGAALLASSVPFELPALPDSVPPEAVERALGVPPAARDLLPAAYRDLPHVYGPVLGAGAVLLALACWFHRAVRIHRWSRTFVLGEPVAVEAGLFSDLAFAFASGIVLLGTAGLAAPWIVAWNRRRFFQACTVKTSRREKKMDFAGTGGEALGLLLLSAASILLAPLTLGVWIAYLRFRWAAWEMAGLLVPSPSGHGMRRARFAGAAGPFLLSEAAGAALRVLTGTLYGPWATSARWRRIAAGTELPPDEREEKRAKRGRSERDEA